MNKTCLKCHVTFDFAKDDIITMELPVKSPPRKRGWPYLGDLYDIFLTKCEVIECPACQDIEILQKKQQIKFIKQIYEPSGLD